MPQNIKVMKDFWCSSMPLTKNSSLFKYYVTQSIAELKHHCSRQTAGLAKSVMGLTKDHWHAQSGHTEEATLGFVKQDL